MNCPSCGRRTKVERTRHRGDETHRLRACECGTTFSTTETATIAISEAADAVRLRDSLADLLERHKVTCASETRICAPAAPAETPKA